MFHISKVFTNVVCIRRKTTTNRNTERQTKAFYLYSYVSRLHIEKSLFKYLCSEHPDKTAQLWSLIRAFTVFLAYLNTKCSRRAIVIGVCPSSVRASVVNFCFKQLLLQNCWTDFGIISKKCFKGEPLPKLLKPCGSIAHLGHRS